MYQFNQTVNTPNGPATYIGIVSRDGEIAGVQVSRHVPMSELTQEERERAHPSIKSMDRESFTAWLKSAKILRNEIYPLEQVTA